MHMCMLYLIHREGKTLCARCRAYYGRRPRAGGRRTPQPGSGTLRARARPRARTVDLMVGKIGFSYEPILAFPTRQGCTPESYELVATFISV